MEVSAVGDKRPPSQVSARRGEVYWVDFEPAQGGEIRKRRPAVVVSNDVANRQLNRVQVVPITSSVGRVYPSEAMVTVGGEARKVMADQLRTVAKERLTGCLGAVSAADMAGIERAIKLQLGLR